MKLENDFYNKLATELQVKYFPNVKYHRDDAQCQKMTYTIELFSNGCLIYAKLIGRIATACKETKENIHAIVSKHVEDFEGYKYTVKKGAKKK